VRFLRWAVPVSMLVAFTAAVGAQGKEKSAGPPTFRKDVFPIIQKNCLPCHAADNFNPSELSMDDYESMSAGGKNGAIWVPGKPEESNLVLKLKDDPPFGDRMPWNSKKKVTEGKAKWLTEDEIKIITTWIDQGAKDN
jgi:hypothetical protein